MNLLFCVLLALQVSPDSLTLERSWSLALEHYPVRQQLHLQEEASLLRTRNLSASYLPAFSLNGAATYQSEVPQIPFSLPGQSPPTVAHDQYRLSADVEQLIYDGGALSHRKALERTTTAIAVQQVEIESLALAEQVSSVYFTALLLQNQLKLLSVLEQDIEAKLTVLNAQVDAGLVLPGNANALRAELVKIGQDRTEMEWSRRTALSTLGILTGAELSASAVLVVPNRRPVGHLDQKSRPEYRQFDLTQFRLEQTAGLVGKRKRPRLAAFAQGAVGRPPGMNIFENDVIPYYQLGLKLSWRFWDWSQIARERDVLAIERSIIETRQSAFDDQMAVAVNRHRADIGRLEELLSTDTEIIALRQQIADEAASLLRNGVFTATDYLIERNATHRAELSREAHKIALEQAFVRLMTTLGEVPWQPIY